MIGAAEARHAGNTWCSFTADLARLQPADYVVASGIFNVKLDHPVDTWREYVLETLATLNRLSRRGFRVQHAVDLFGPRQSVARICSMRIHGRCSTSASGGSRRGCRCSTTIRSTNSRLL